MKRRKSGLFTQSRLKFSHSGLASTPKSSDKKK